MVPRSLLLSKCLARCQATLFSWRRQLLHVPVVLPEHGETGSAADHSPKESGEYFTRPMEQAVSKLANPPVLVYPDLDAISDGSRAIFRLHCDANRNEFDGTL